MTENSLQPNNGYGPVALWTGVAENPVMPKRGPYDKGPKPPPPPERRNRIKRWRIFHGFTQESLAEESGLSPGQVADIENGEIGWSSESLYSISTALKTPRGKLLDEDPPKKK